LHTAIRAEIVQEYCHLNEPRKAISLSKELIEAPGYRELAYYCMGVAFQQLGDLDSAIEAYAKTISPDARDPERYLKRGDKYLSLGESSLAIEDYTSAIRLDPDWGTAYYHRARAYADQEEMAQAIADYSSAIDRADGRPTLLEALLFRGQIYCKVGECGRAIEDFDKCIDLGSTDARVYLYKGYALMGLHAFEKAVKALEMAKAKKPDSQKAVELLGIAHSALAYSLLEESAGEPTRCQTTRIIHHLICASENDMEPRSGEDFACCFDQRIK
jgi:tetratricopeptide (TPR) repeat protein